MQKNDKVQNSSRCFIGIKCGGDSSVVERRVSDRKVADSRFDSRAGKAQLCPKKIHLTYISHRGPSSLPFVVAQPDERIANRTQKRALRSALVWLDFALSNWFIRTNKRSVSLRDSYVQKNNSTYSNAYRFDKISKLKIGITLNCPQKQ